MWERRGVVLAYKLDGHGLARDYSPARSSDLLRLPPPVAQVQINGVTEPSYADEHFLLQSVERGAGRDGRASVGQGLRTGGLAVLSVEASQEPLGEAPALQWPGLLVAVHLDGSVSFAVRGVKQLGLIGVIDEQLALGRPRFPTFLRALTSVPVGLTFATYTFLGAKRIRKLCLRDYSHGPFLKAPRIFDQPSVHIRSVRRIFGPLDHPDAPSPRLDQLPGILTGLPLLASVVEDHDLEVRELCGVHRLQEPCAGLGDRRVAHLAQAQRVFLATAEDDQRAGL